MFRLRAGTGIHPPATSGAGQSRDAGRCAPVLGGAVPYGTPRGSFADNRMARGAAYNRPTRPSGGFSAGVGRGGRRALLRNNPGEHAAHLAGAEGTAWVLPGQPLRLSPRTRPCSCNANPCASNISTLARPHQRRL